MTIILYRSYNHDIIIVFLLKRKFVEHAKYMRRIAVCIIVKKPLNLVGD